MISHNIHHIAIVCAGYPTVDKPYQGTFVEQLVIAFAKAGIRCTVIHPITRIGRTHASREISLQVKSYAPGVDVTIHSPRYISLGNHRLAQHINTRNFAQAVRRVMETIDRPDILYGHFLYPAGATAVQIGREMQIPAFVASGEESLSHLDTIGLSKVRRNFSGINGVVAVSSLLKRQLLEKDIVPSEYIGVFPNGVDHAKFYPHDRQAMRRKFDLPENQFIIAFVGYFINRKGPLRVVQAIQKMEDVGAIFIGKGPETPQSKQILFKGALPQFQIPEYLSAADIFVLPTTCEGSCNAIIEAMACGLPVVTSSGDFNSDIVDEHTAIQVDALDIDGLSLAIKSLRDDPERRTMMSNAALARASELEINFRAQNIIDFLETRLTEVTLLSAQ